MASVSTYNVTATREGRYWVLDIEGVGITQARHLAEAQTMVEDYIRLDRGADALDGAHVAVRVIVDGLEEEVEAARREVQDAVAAQARAAERSRAVARKLRDAGLTGADAAHVMDVSPQRYSQLVNA
jgi:predicted transcriptional regulator